jgi:putative hydrolase
MAGDPFGGGMGDNPFGGMPFLGDMMKALTGQGPLNWDMARQIAFMSASGGSEGVTNVEPTTRIALEQLVPVAQMHIDNLLGIGGTTAAKIDCVTPVQWCHHALDAYKPLLNDLAAALAQQPPTSGENPDQLDQSDQMAAMMSGIMAAMAPAMLGMAVGSMVGQLALRAFGQYDLLLPRDPRQPVRIVAANIDTFAEEWSLPVSDMRMWVLIHELCAHTILSVPHIHDELLDCVQSHVRAFRPDPSAAFEKMTNVELDMENPMGAIQQTFSDPELLLGAVISPEQQAMRPRFDALLATLVGLLDWAVDAISAQLLGGSAAVSEAVRRRRIESSTSDRFVEHLLGIHHTRDIVDRGRSFVSGVIERSNADVLLKLLTEPATLPTQAEIDAPGLWLARIEIDAQRADEG